MPTDIIFCMIFSLKPTFAKKTSKCYNLQQTHSLDDNFAQTDLSVLSRVDSICGPYKTVQRCKETVLGCHASAGCKHEVHRVDVHDFAQHLSPPLFNGTRDSGEVQWEAHSASALYW